MRQLNLGQLVYELEKYKGEKNVRFDFGSFSPDGFDSYRGYYEQLALGFRESPQITVDALLKECNETMCKEFTGWKGGEYVMYPETPLWVANVGRTSGTAIVGVTDYGWQVIINTAYID